MHAGMDNIETNKILFIIRSVIPICSFASGPSQTAGTLNMLLSCAQRSRWIWLYFSPLIWVLRRSPESTGMDDMYEVGQTIHKLTPEVKTELTGLSPVTYTDRP